MRRPWTSGTIAGVRGATRTTATSPGITRSGRVRGTGKP